MSAWIELVGKFAKTDEDIELFGRALGEVEENRHQRTLAAVASWMNDLSAKTWHTDSTVGPFEVTVHDADTAGDHSVPAVLTALNALLRERRSP